MPRLVHKHWIWMVVVASTAVGLVLRAAFVGRQSIGYEEASTLFVVTRSSVPEMWRTLEHTEANPVLFYLLVKAWTWISGGHSAVDLRMVSVIAGTLTVPAAFAALRRFVGDRLAAAVAWLVAVSPILVDYSIYARAYALLVLLSALSLGALGAVLERPSWRRWALWGVATTAGLWTHYFFVFLLAAELLVLFVYLPGQRRALLGAAAGIAVVAAPLVPLAIAQASTSSQFTFIRAAPLAQRVGEIGRQFAVGTNVPHAWLELIGILLFVCALAVAVVQTRDRRSTRILVALSVVGAAPPLAAAVLGIRDYILPSNFLFLWICVAPLAAWGLVRRGGAPLVAYSVVCLSTIVVTLGDWRYQGLTDWGGASARVRSQVGAAPIAIAPGRESSVAEVYLHRTALTSTILTRDLWVMMEPVRGAGERALTPVSTAPILALWGPGWRSVGEVDYHGFEMVHLQSPVAQPVGPNPGGGPASNPTALVLAP